MKKTSLYIIVIAIVILIIYLMIQNQIIENNREKLYQIFQDELEGKINKKNEEWLKNKGIEVFVSYDKNNSFYDDSLVFFKQGKTTIIYDFAIRKRNFEDIEIPTAAYKLTKIENRWYKEEITGFD